MKMNVLELYSGIGGMHFALKASLIDGKVVSSADINPIANGVYKYNFPNTPLLNRNIESFTSDFINKLNIDMILMSPPCQPFTRNGNFGDMEDHRTDSFIYLLSILKELKDLRFILIENVKGFEKSETRSLLVNSLREADFNFQEFLLNPVDFGVPNSRQRYYCLARKKPMKFDFKMEEPLTSIPNLKTSPNEPYEIKDILEKNIHFGEYAIREKDLLKYINVLDIVYENSRRTTCFTKAYGRYLNGTGSVFCALDQSEAEKILLKLKNKEIELTPAQLKELQLRYFTPNEVARLMCFPESFKFPPNVTTKQKYRLLGNSINVKIVALLIQYLINDHS